MRLGPHVAGCPPVLVPGSANFGQCFSTSSTSRSIVSGIGYSSQQSSAQNCFSSSAVMNAFSNLSSNPPTYGWFGCVN